MDQLDTQFVYHNLVYVIWMNNDEQVFFSTLGRMHQITHTHRISKWCSIQHPTAGVLITDYLHRFSFVDTRSSSSSSVMAIIAPVAHVAPNDPLTFTSDRQIIQTSHT